MKNLEAGLKKNISRRTFIKSGALVGAAAALAPDTLFAAGGEMPDVWVVHSDDKKKLMAKCLEIINANGGFGKAKTMALKVNSAWTRTPEQGANTDPELVELFLKGCKKAGIKNITLPEHPCHAARTAFTKSGILEAAREEGAEMIDLKSNSRDYKKISIPEGKILKDALVAKQFLNSDIVVNMPVAKHHSGATLSMAMKNWMGAVKDRGYWHRNGLHQCIADFCTFMKPSWTIIDATRTMMDSGPQGPAKNLKHPDLLIISKNQVSADAYAATLFHDSPKKVAYIKIAGQMGLGPISLDRMKIHKIEA